MNKLFRFPVTQLIKLTLRGPCSLMGGASLINNIHLYQVINHNYSCVFDRCHVCILKIKKLWLKLYEIVVVDR